MISLRAIQDTWLRGIEHTYRDNLKQGYDLGVIDKASTQSSYAEFSFWYLMSAILVFQFTDSFISACLTFLTLAILQLLCGTEDFLHYVFEPLFQHPNRDTRYPVKFLIWRFPRTLHWLGAGDNEGHSGWHNPLLMFFCGKEVRLVPFLWVVLISNLIVILIAILT